MSRKRNKPLTVKIHGPREKVEAFLDHLDEYYFCVYSPVMPTREGGYHAYATIREAWE